MKRSLVLLSVLFSLYTAVAQTWIWYPGDYELWLGNKMNNRRTERGAFFPPFWKTDSHYAVVEFSKEVNLLEPEIIDIAVEGKFNVKINGKLQFGMPSSITLSAGKNKINIKVWNQTTPPAIYVSGKTVKSDSSWKVTFEDKEWIDESGKASDTSATEYMAAGSWHFDSKNDLPSKCKLPCKLQNHVSFMSGDEGIVYDFGKETFGYVVLKGVKGNGKVSIYYGESKEEALDKEYCETLDVLLFKDELVTDLSTNNVSERNDDYTLHGSKAFRYVYIVLESGVTLSDVAMNFEYLPVEQKGSFRCNDEDINKIWEIGAYTMYLTTREFFIDGIKRDRWVWSGDAIQSYLMNYYLFFEKDAVERTIWLLRGKDPITSHINTILDYTFFWFLSIYDYYMYTGNSEFVEQIYPRMKSMMDFVLSRTNSEGMVEGQTGDWVFVDWADGYLDKKGELSFEQILFCKSLETMSLCSSLVGDSKSNVIYEKRAKDLRAKLDEAFWNDEKGAMVHNRIDGKQCSTVTRYANMFSVLYGYLDNDKKTKVRDNVLLNDSILRITTPYMRFYELEALCCLGEQDKVMSEIKSYWGGMVKENATTFWEKYDPTQSGRGHYAMYNRPYGKSLCHAWGASPIYLIGKYYLGVKPVEPGYQKFEIRPDLGGLKWMEGTVPVPGGKIDVYMNNRSIRVQASKGCGYLYFSSKRTPKVNVGKIESLGSDNYKVYIESGKLVEIDYK